MLSFVKLLKYLGKFWRRAPLALPRTTHLLWSHHTLPIDRREACKQEKIFKLYKFTFVGRVMSMSQEIIQADQDTSALPFMMLNRINSQFLFCNLYNQTAKLSKLYDNKMLPCSETGRVGGGHQTIVRNFPEKAVWYQPGWSYISSLPNTRHH